MKPGYHDLYVTTEAIPRTALFDLPFNLMVICHRTCGWELRDQKRDVPIAGEYHENWLVLDVNGTVIIDSRKEGR
jgi:hypothetical protein